MMATEKKEKVQFDSIPLKPIGNYAKVTITLQGTILIYREDNRDNLITVDTPLEISNLEEIKRMDGMKFDLRPRPIPSLHPSSGRRWPAISASGTALGDPPLGLFLGGYN